MFRTRPLFHALPLLFLAPLVAVGACGSGDDTGPDESPLAIARTSTASGEGQQGLVKEALPGPLRVVVTRNGEPVEDVEVEWQADDEGAMDPVRSTTGPDGVAESAWTLGPTAGEQTASAVLEEADGSPVGFTATAIEDAPPLGVTVELLASSFDPANVVIEVGQTVTWVWPAGGPAHNVVPDDNTTPTGSGPLGTGPAQYSFTFTQPGVYPYYCAAHGGKNGVGMAGTVTVLTELP